MAESDAADVYDGFEDAEGLDERVEATVGAWVIETVPVELCENDPEMLAIPEAVLLCEGELERVSWRLRVCWAVLDADTAPDTDSRGVELKAIVIDESADRLLEVVVLAETDLVARGLIELDSLAVVLAEPLELLELDGLAETEFEFLAVLD